MGMPSKLPGVDGLLSARGGRNQPPWFWKQGGPFSSDAVGRIGKGQLVPATLPPLHTEPDRGFPPLSGSKFFLEKTKSMGQMYGQPSKKRVAKVWLCPFGLPLRLLSRPIPAPLGTG